MKELLKQHNLKITNNRLEILDIIKELDLDATIKNILTKTKIDKSTVYRTIETLLKNNVIETSIKTAITRTIMLFFISSSPFMLNTTQYFKFCLYAIIFVLCIHQGYHLLA